MIYIALQIEEPTGQKVGRKEAHKPSQPYEQGGMQHQLHHPLARHHKDRKPACRDDPEL
jgi:hypothetical protein